MDRAVANAEDPQERLTQNKCNRDTCQQQCQTLRAETERPRCSIQDRLQGQEVRASLAGWLQDCAR